MASRYRPPHHFGVGGVGIGNEFHFVTDEQAEATLSAAWDAGVRYFDVSPWYGLGLAERRFGRFLARKPRDEFIISSKVGKLLQAAATTRGVSTSHSARRPTRRISTIPPTGCVARSRTVSSA